MKLSKEAIEFLNELVDYTSDKQHVSFEEIYKLDLTRSYDSIVNYIKEIESTDIIDSSKIGNYIEYAIEFMCDTNSLGVHFITTKSKNLKVGYEEILEKI